jgi:MoaA/NifB/PqqE/SkfB family radical SAM enzyme
MEDLEMNERVEQIPDPFHTIQIHPTRKCNLACLHCYSSSGPGFKEMLDIKALKRFLEYAYQHGFNNISVSGGEPFLYNGLEELFKYSRSLGYQNTMASNGMLLQSERNQRILEYVDLIAISLDGPEELHDKIRGQRGAFARMLKGVDVLKSLNKAFGFIHTVTSESWDKLLWLGEFAHTSGAKLLQLHPLEMYGRAKEQLVEMSIDDTLAHQTFILAHYLKSKYADTMVVQLDLLHRDYLEEFPQIVNCFERECAKKGRISNLLDTIIIEETGRVLPIAYGVASKYVIGNVHSFENSLFDQYITEKIPLIKNLFNRTLNKIFANKQIDIVNWNELLVHESKIELLTPQS